VKTAKRDGPSPPTVLGKEQGEGQLENKKSISCGSWMRKPEGKKETPDGGTRTKKRVGGGGVVDARGASLLFRPFTRGA